MPAKTVDAKYLMDTYGLRAAFNSSDNAIRSSVISSLEKGELRVMRAASDDLKNLDEDAYADFQASVSSKKYIKTLNKHETIRASLMNKYGASIFGRSPSPECFEALAICATEGLCFVTSGKPLNDSNKIKQKCKLNGVSVMSLSEFSSLSP